LTPNSQYRLLYPSPWLRNTTLEENPPTLKTLDHLSEAEKEKKRKKERTKIPPFLDISGHVSNLRIFLGFLDKPLVPGV